MRYTLLELTQKVLSAIDGDSVSGISDTVESRSVVAIIERQYLELTNAGSLPEDFRLFNFDATGTSTPVVLQRPSYIDEVLWFKYNKVTEVDGEDIFSDVVYQKPELFFDRMASLSTSATNVDTCDITNDTGDTIRFYYTTDKPPDFWTSFDDKYIICDSYASDVESNLQQSKARGYGRFIKTFTVSDSFVPDIDDNLFPILLNESIATAFAELKQTQNARAERKARNGWIRSQKRKLDLPGNLSGLDRAPNYGRK